MKKRNSWLPLEGYFTIGKSSFYKYMYPNPDIQMIIIFFSFSDSTILEITIIRKDMDVYKYQILSNFTLFLLFYISVSSESSIMSISHIIKRVWNDLYPAVEYAWNSIHYPTKPTTSVYWYMCREFVVFSTLRWGIVANHFLTCYWHFPFI